MSLLEGEKVKIFTGEDNCLGNGFYGKVFKGNWAKKLCAVKKLRTSTKYSSVQINKDTIYKIEELKNLITLELHKNIVRIFGAYTERNRCYLVMEYVEGVSFYKYLYEESDFVISEDRAHYLLFQLAKGMDHLHSNKILHRNLNTRCLILTKKYALLKICLDLTESSGVPISVYTAPEAIRLNNYETLSDVYSFGIITWEVMTRQLYGLHWDEETISYLTLKGIRPNLESVKADKDFFQTLIKLCWDADPEKRPPMKILANWLSFSWPTEKNVVE